MCVFREGPTRTAALPLQGLKTSDPLIKMKEVFRTVAKAMIGCEILLDKVEFCWQFFLVSRRWSRLGSQLFHRRTICLKNRSRDTCTKRRGNKGRSRSRNGGSTSGRAWNKSRIPNRSPNRFGGPSAQSGIIVHAQVVGTIVDVTTLKTSVLPLECLLLDAF